ncbi:ribonuclease HII [bacterium]|nr:ribonuclease HII [bacterium]
MDILEEEKKLQKKGFKIIACLDESGRGPLAGPVVACALVLLPRKKFDHTVFKLMRKMKDSKKLSTRKREEIFDIILSCPQIEYATSRVTEKTIDKINVLQATKLAMKRAVAKLQKKLGKRIDFLIIDGNFGIDLDIPQKSIIKGDQKIFSCMAASIVAKVLRDRIMKNYHKKFPHYRFDLHKGYPTKTHRMLLRKYGPCKIHRKTFAPLRELKSH